jgi:hypothetical protein
MYQTANWQNSPSRKAVATLKKMPVPLTYIETPTKRKTDFTIEQPLLREDTIDSAFKRSAEKNLFELPRDEQGLSSKNSSAQFKMPQTPEYYPSFGAEYDHGALFKAAEAYTSSMNNIYRTQSDEDAREISKYMETTLLLDKIGTTFESKFLSKQPAQNASERHIRVDMNISDRTNLTLPQGEQNRTMNSKQKARRLNYDESTYLPEATLNRSDEYLSEDRPIQTIDWNKFDMEANLEELAKNDEELPNVGLEKHMVNDFTFLLQSVPGTAQKRSKRFLFRNRWKYLP